MSFENREDVYEIGIDLVDDPVAAQEDFAHIFPVQLRDFASCLRSGGQPSEPARGA